MRESRGGSVFGFGVRYKDSWWCARESVTRARGVSKKSWMVECMYELRCMKKRRRRARATYLALRHSPQSLDQFKPLFGSVSLLDLIQPCHGSLHHSLNRAFQLTVFLAQDAYTRVELRILSCVILVLDYCFDESRR